MRWHAVAGLGVVSFALMLSGCGGVGDANKVTGTVTFSDGSPLTKGTVVFASPEATAQGEIQSDGSYALGSFGADDGAPAGSYTVFLSGPIFASEGETSDPGDEDEGELESYDDAMPDEAGEALVHIKFSAPDTSGLTCDVSGTTTFDITVEQPE